MSDGESPRWLSRAAILTLHYRCLALHGGAAGLRDAGLLDSALAQPLNRHAYEDLTDVVELAAIYAAAICANHPFIDGNKRTAFLAAGVFLELNGARLVARPADATLAMFSLARADMDIPGLAAWIGSNLGDRRVHLPARGLLARALTILAISA